MLYIWSQATEEDSFEILVLQSLWKNILWLAYYYIMTSKEAEIIKKIIVEIGDIANGKLFPYAEPEERLIYIAEITNKLKT